MEEGKNEKERGVVVTEALSLYPSVVFGVSQTLRFATLTESLFEAESAGRSSAGCSFRMCCFRWTSVLHHTLHSSERGLESSSNFIIQHSLPSQLHSAPGTESVRETTLSFHSGLLSVVMSHV